MGVVAKVGPAFPFELPVQGNVMSRSDPENAFRVLVPPDDEVVVVSTIDDALDLVFTLQPAEDALVALLDDRKRLRAVVETPSDCLVHVVDLAAGLDDVDSALVCTAEAVTMAAPEDALVAWHRLWAAFDDRGVTLVDWLQVDVHHVRSLAETASLSVQ